MSTIDDSESAGPLLKVITSVTAGMATIGVGGEAEQVNGGVSAEHLITHVDHAGPVRRWSVDGGIIGEPAPGLLPVSPQVLVQKRHGIHGRRAGLPTAIRTV